jgi:hypothetical protein
MQARDAVLVDVEVLADQLAQQRVCLFNRLIVEQAGQRSSGLRARTIADVACSCTWCVSGSSMSLSPAPASACSNSVRVSAPATQPVYCSMSVRVASSMSESAITSETAKRPPGRSTRAASASTLDFSAERLITQFEPAEEGGPTDIPDMPIHRDGCAVEQGSGSE